MTDAEARLLSTLLDGATVRRISPGRWSLGGSAWATANDGATAMHATVSGALDKGWVIQTSAGSPLMLTARGYEAISAQRGGETSLQKSIVAALRSALPWAKVLHFANGGKRRRVEAAILKGMGVEPGAADIIVVGHGFAGFMEVKTPTGTQSPDQVAFEADCDRKGIPYVIVESVKEALRIGREWGRGREL